jgi:hypothetical protein
MGHAAASENALDVETVCPLPDIFTRPTARANNESRVAPLGAIGVYADVHLPISL